MHTSFTASLLLVLASLAACRSAPVHYHTLMPLLVGTSHSVQPTSNLLIERVTVPPQVDRTQIVLRQGDNGLTVLETEWWGASLADELQSALVDQLNQDPMFARKTSLRVDVQRFDLVPGRYALLDVKWRLRSKPTDGGSAQELSCQGVLQARSGRSVEELVRAQQENLRGIAKLIGMSDQGQCPSS